MENEIETKLPGELLIKLRKSKGYRSFKRRSEDADALVEPQTWRGITVFAEMTGWTYWKLHRLERIRRDVSPAKWKPAFTQRDLDDLIEADWFAEGDCWHAKFVCGLRLQDEMLEQYDLPRGPAEPEPDLSTHSPVTPEEIRVVAEAVYRQQASEMERLSHQIAKMLVLQRRIEEGIISILEKQQLVKQHEQSGKITPEDEVTRGVSEVLSGRDVHDIPRLRTLRLVYDLTNEMIEDALWEAKTEQ